MKQFVDAFKAINAKRSVDGVEAVRKSDGCTGVPDWNIRHCCEKHDMGYMNPATSRWQDDCDFYACMKNHMSWWNPLPVIYFLGVRAVGGARHCAFQEYNYDDDSMELMQ